MLTKEEIDTYMAEGTLAYFQNRGQNPHNKHSDHGRLWLRGFINAQWSDEHNLT